MGLLPELELIIMSTQAECGMLCISRMRIHVVSDAEPPDKRSYFGAAWAFEDRYYFSNNMGSGIYQLIFYHKLGKSSLPILYHIRKNSPSYRMDGLFCFNVHDPFLTPTQDFPSIFPFSEDTAYRISSSTTPILSS